MTRDLTDKYLANRSFYKIQSELLVDNPDQRISSDIRYAALCTVDRVVTAPVVAWVCACVCDLPDTQTSHRSNVLCCVVLRCIASQTNTPSSHHPSLHWYTVHITSSHHSAFTDTAVSLSVVVLNSIIDLVSFSEILYSIYPPLFVALLVYSVGGTWVSVKLGQPLVGLNFRQEAQEAELRYGLVRIRENSESIAFYGGERSEARLLGDRLKGVVANYGELLIASRNLSFFTGGYRYLIQILPAAVIAPLFFQGRIQFGVINQSLSAFNHILSDVSLIVYQFESLAGFSAVVDRLGEFCEVVDSSSKAEQARAHSGDGGDGATRQQAAIQLQDAPRNGANLLSTAPVSLFWFLIFVSASRTLHTSVYLPYVALLPLWIRRSRCLIQ